METKDPLPFRHITFLRSILILPSNICVGHLSCIFDADSQISSHFDKGTYCAGKKILNSLPCRLTSFMNEKQLYENTQCIQLRQCQWIYDDYSDSQSYSLLYVLDSV